MKKLSCSLFVSISATLINSSVTFPSSQRRVDAPSEAKAQTGWSERNHDASHLNHEFYLELSTQFDHVVKQVSPALDRVFREWIGRPLDTDLWKDVRLSGFGVEPLNSVPITWDVMFETTGEKWLAITVPFVGDSPQDPVVDT